MNAWDDIFEPQTEEDCEIAETEALVFAIQKQIQQAMNEAGIDNKGLAKRMGCTPARISQIFSSAGPNMTVKTLVKLMRAFDDTWIIERTSKVRVRSKVSARSGGRKPHGLEAVARTMPVDFSINTHRVISPSNDNTVSKVMAA